jgi:hypothetical protein
MQFQRMGHDTRGKLKLCGRTAQLSHVGKVPAVDPPNGATWLLVGLGVSHNFLILNAALHADSDVALVQRSTGTRYTPPWGCHRRWSSPPPTSRSS